MKCLPNSAPANNQSLRDFRVRLRFDSVILYCKGQFFAEWGDAMRIHGSAVLFDPCDAAFVRKFGTENAAEMVLDYKSAQPLPFIYDTYQMADFLKVGRKELFYYTKNADTQYRPMKIQKKNGGVRCLYVPSRPLQAIQRKILREILIKLPISKYATAYAKGKTLMQNAVPHVGKHYLLKLDIMDFFGSIRFTQVYGTVFNTKYFPKQIGTMFTELCCREDVLPQGAATSPALSNLVMRNFDDSIGKWCAARGIAYTRYCDDMTFSANQPLFAVYRKVQSMLLEMGFVLHEKKTRFITPARRQNVTGLTVNERVSVSADYKRALRQEVYYALKFGLSDSLLHTGRTDFMDGCTPNPTEYAMHLIGRLHFVLQIEPENQWFRNALQALESRAKIQ